MKRLGALLNAWGRVQAPAAAITASLGAKEPSPATGASVSAARVPVPPSSAGKTGASDGSSRRDLKERYLLAIDVFQDLPDSEVARVAQMTQMVTCQRGRAVFRAGDHSDTLFLLKRGRVQIVRETADGRRLVTAILGPETFFGEMALIGQRFPRDSTAEALDDVMVCVMSRYDVEQLVLRHPRVGLRFLEQVGARLVETQAMVEAFAFKPVAARLAGTLLDLSAAAPAAPIHLSHQELADMVASYRETVTLALRGFQQRRLVDLGRRSVLVRDRPGLAAEAESNA